MTVLSAGLMRSWNVPFLLIQNLTTGVTLSVSTVTLVILYSKLSSPVGRSGLLGVAFTVRWTNEGCKVSLPWHWTMAQLASSAWARFNGGACPAPVAKLTLMWQDPQATLVGRVFQLRPSNPLWHFEQFLTSRIPNFGLITPKGEGFSIRMG